MKSIVTNLLAVWMLAIIASCAGTKSESAETEVATEEESIAETEELSAVCVWNDISVRKNPGTKREDYLTKLSIGESLTYLGADSAVEEKTYAKVRLNDGEEGWSRKDFLVIEGKAAVIVTDATIYSRPDLLTKTDKLFSAMDIIASVETQDDWSSVRGKRSEGSWLDEGWIKSDNISYAAEDIATAKFASKAFELESTDEQIQALKEIVENEDLSSSKFIAGLVVKLTELSDAAAAPADSIN